jgi:hypothetical protein
MPSLYRPIFCLILRQQWFKIREKRAARIAISRAGSHQARAGSYQKSTTGNTLTLLVADGQHQQLMHACACAQSMERRRIWKRDRQLLRWRSYHT